MPEVKIRIDVIGPAGHHQAVQIRTGKGPVCRRGKQPILASGGERANIPLGNIIVNAEMPVFQVDYQFRPLVQRISDRRADDTFRQHALTRFGQPVVEGFQNRRRFFLS
ncbi:hypothetical protein Xekj_04317 [Xenorhabdus sp. KJ12.1]|nr:hypothetical protein Xekj_04317 [Xenorhabdus sp. KJ12.1]